MDNMDKLHKQIKRQNEYNKKNYANISIRIKPNDNTIIDEYCKKTGISKAKFIVRACKYCIENKIELE